MEFVQLGKSDVKISRILFGAWAIGGWMWGGTDESQAIEALQKSIELGVNTIDTAPIYGMGLSEEIVGKAIRGKREKVVIATKCGFRWDVQEGSSPWHQQDSQGRPLTIYKNSKAHSIIEECERSLKRLGIDVIDLYQIHSPDLSTPIEESWQAMVKLKEQGKVRAIGVSNYNLEQLKQAQAIHSVDSLQPPYSLLRKGIEQDLIPYCKENGISIIAYSPLERGILSGKISKEHHFKEGDHRSKHPLYTRENREKIVALLDEIRPIAEKHKMTMSQLILNCTLQLKTVDGLLVGARNAEQAVENARALDFTLTKEEVTFIADLFNQHSPVRKS